MVLFVLFKIVFCYELRFYIFVLFFIFLIIVDWYYFWGIDNIVRIIKFLFSYILFVKLVILRKYFVSELERSGLWKYCYSVGFLN